MVGELYGFRDENPLALGFNILIGFGVLLFMIWLNSAFGVAIGFPAPFASQNWVNFLVIYFLAGFGEALAFRMVLLPILNKAITPLWSILALSAGFSVFHWAIYGGFSRATLGLFLGAFIFSVIISTVCTLTRSVTPELVAHPNFNWYLWNQSPYAVISFSVAGIAVPLIHRAFLNYRGEKK